MTDKEILSELYINVCVLDVDDPLDNPLFDAIYQACLSEKETLTPLRIKEIADEKISTFQNLQMEFRKIERNSLMKG